MPISRSLVCGSGPCHSLLLGLRTRVPSCVPNRDVHGNGRHETDGLPQLGRIRQRKIARTIRFPHPPTYKYYSLTLWRSIVANNVRRLLRHSQSSVLPTVLLLSVRARPRINHPAPAPPTSLPDQSMASVVGVSISRNSQRNRFLGELNTCYGVTTKRARPQ